MTNKKIEITYYVDTDENPYATYMTIGNPEAQYIPETFLNFDVVPYVRLLEPVTRYISGKINGISLYVIERKPERLPQATLPWLEVIKVINEEKNIISFCLMLKDKLLYDADEKIYASPWNTVPIGDCANLIDYFEKNSFWTPSYDANDYHFEYMIKALHQRVNQTPRVWTTGSIEDALEHACKETDVVTLQQIHDDYTNLAVGNVLTLSEIFGNAQASTRL